MKNFFLSSLTNAINRILNLDPDSAHRLKKLQGKTISIELLPFHFIFHCCFNENGVIVKEGPTENADTNISGTPLQMLNVMLLKNERQRFFSEDLMMEGNAEIGQEMIRLFDELYIDWEEMLSHLVGDVSAHHVGRFVDSVTDWLTQAKKNIGQDMSEFMHEEARLFPARLALQDFFDDIDALRMDVDRIEAKIKLLETSFINQDDVINHKENE